VQQSGDCLEGEIRKTIKTEPLQSVIPFLDSKNPGNDYGEDDYHHYEGPDYHEQNDVDVLGRHDGSGVPGDPYAHLKAHCTRAKGGGLCLSGVHKEREGEYTCHMCGLILSSYKKWKLHTKKYHGKILND